jgi:hypothetical protein
VHDVIEDEILKVLDQKITSKSLEALGAGTTRGRSSGRCRARTQGDRRCRPVHLKCGRRRGSLDPADELRATRSLDPSELAARSLDRWRGRAMNYGVRNSGAVRRSPLAWTKVSPSCPCSPSGRG